MLAIILALAATGNDVTQICTLREASNAGIVARDADRAASNLASDVHVVTSGNTMIEGAAEMRAAFAKTFANADFIAMQRRPVRVRVAGATAAEHGSWHSAWRDRTLGGDYLVRWQRGADGWRAVGELYIPLPASAAPGSTRSLAPLPAPPRRSRTGPGRSRTSCG
jgi:ketosteroid isomerase-like protein